MTLHTEKYKPKGFSKTRMKEALKKEGVDVLSDVPDVVFNAKEQAEIVEEWNSTLGRKVCDTIVRKYWFVHDGVEEPEGEKAGRVIGMRNRSEYNTLKHIADYMIINYVGCPDGPQGAVWKNYTGKPRPKERSRPDDGQWKKVDASMTSVFGKPYLTEEDWRINI